MPEEGVQWLPKDQLLTFEEVLAITKAAATIHQIRRFKLTGGEPTLRRGIVELIRMLKQSGYTDDLSLTTNGQLLYELADPFKQAGLDRITVSLDSLLPERFKSITRTGVLGDVLRGIDRCIELGFTSIKINCVTMKGFNDDEVAEFARLTIDRPITVRFIEYMPLGYSGFSPEPKTSLSERLKISADEIGPVGGCGAQERGDVFVSEELTKSRIVDVFGEIEPVDRSTESGVGPAEVYRLKNAKGRIGFISAMSKPFCSTCNRLRLTATGLLRSCLFEGGEVDLKPIIRDHSKTNIPERLADAMSECVRLKPEVHSYHGNEQMSRIGG